MGERYNITVNGKVIDAITKKPIANAQVVALCWYHVGLDDATFNKITTNTKENGSFTFQFTRGYQVDVAAKANHYSPYRISKELGNNHLLVELPLQVAQSSPTLKAYLIAHLFEDPKIPFLRQRVYSKPGTSELDANQIESWGYSFKDARNTASSDSADIWFKKTEVEAFPTMLMTSQKGGIYPVYENQIQSSFLFEITSAPTNGYLSSYLFKGNEVGFFIRCRDGRYAKIIREKAEIQLGAPSKEGYYEERGYRFSVLFQPDGTKNLSYHEEIDLERFLVDITYH